MEIYKTEQESIKKHNGERYIIVLETQNSMFDATIYDTKKGIDDYGDNGYGKHKFWSHRVCEVSTLDDAKIICKSLNMYSSTCINGGERINVDGCSKCSLLWSKSCHI